MTRDLEARLLASVPTIGHFQRLEELGITETSFQVYGPMYRYIEQIVREHNHLPRLLDLKATFNVPEHIQRKPQEYEWLLGEFLKLTTVQRVQQVLDQTVEKYGEEPADLITALIRELTQLVLPNKRTGSISDQSANERMKSYAERIADENMVVGIPTGLRYFDSVHRLGWFRGELNGIVGRLYIGKSWMLIYHGAVAWLAGYRVLMLSPEMPKEEAEARLDCILFGLHGVDCDISELYRGYQPTPQQREVAAKMAERANWITLSSDDDRPFNIGEIPRFVRQFNPDIVLIDGLPLIAPTSRGSKLWEQIKDISYSLKNIAVGMNVVVLVTHQANRDAHNIAKPPELHEIAYGDAFGQACDRVIALSRSTQPQRLRLTIQKFRKGQAQPRGSVYEFNPGRGRIGELDEHTGAAGEPGDNGAALQAGQGDIDLLPIP